MILLDRNLRVAICVTLAGWFFACGSDSTSGGGDDGGTSSTGAGGSMNAECQLPACYYDFLNEVRACSPMGTCVEQSDLADTSATLRICYSNGSKWISTTSQVDLSFTGVATGPDGATCYSVKGALAKSDAGAIYLSTRSFVNAAGQIVATEDAARSLTAVCAGQVKSVPPSCNPAVPGVPSDPCAMGTCM